MSARAVTECGLCGSQRLETVLDLGTSPPTCVMQPIGADVGPEERYPLTLLRCEECTLVQLSTVVEAETVFPPGYPYSSGNSAALHANFEDLARTAEHWAGGLSESDLVVDIGANDGTLLSKFGRCRTVGVEPTLQAERISGDAYRAFFTEQVAAWILADHGPARVVTACNVLAHVEDIGSVMRGIDLLLADDGILIAENHDLASVVDEGQWDTVYHEHLRFYSPHSFDRLLDAYGFGSRDCTPIPTHGGSFRTVAGKGQREELIPDRKYDFGDLADRAEEAREGILDAVGEVNVWGVGATARATTIVNYCGLDVDRVECVCEVAGSDKIGFYIPGTRIPVIDERHLFEEQPPRVLLFSWHLADRIVPALRAGGYGGTIVVPLPTVRWIPAAHAQAT